VIGLKCSDTAWAPAGASMPAGCAAAAAAPGLACPGFGTPDARRLGGVPICVSAATSFSSFKSGMSGLETRFSSAMVCCTSFSGTMRRSFSMPSHCWV